jgi:folate-binding protein YgfZ
MGETAEQGTSGSAPAGYEAARAGAAFFPLASRGILEVKGPDRAKFLQAMLSNDVAGLSPGDSRLCALLNVKGQIQALLRVYATPQALWLEAPRDLLGGIEATLQHYRVAAPVRFEARPTRVTAVLGPRAGDVLQDRPEPRTAATDLPAGGLVVYSSPEEEPELAAALAAAGAVPLDQPALDALRVEEGRAWFGIDVGEESLLHETGLLAEYASLTKGCYLGQEVVARLEGRGAHVNRALRGLRLDAPAAAGTLLTAEGSEVGRITTAAVSPAQGPIAMALVRRSHFEPGTVLDAAGTRATVSALPMIPRG